MNESHLSRRDFIKFCGLVAASWALASCASPSGLGSGKENPTGNYEGGVYFLNKPWVQLTNGLTQASLPLDAMKQSLSQLDLEGSSIVHSLKDGTIRAEWVDATASTPSVSNALFDGSGAVIAYSATERQQQKSAFLSSLEKDTTTVVDRSGAHTTTFIKPKTYADENGLDKTQVEINLPEDLGWAYEERDGSGNIKQNVIGNNAFTASMVHTLTEYQYSLESTIRNQTGNTSGQLDPSQVQTILDARNNLLTTLIDPQLDAATRTFNMTQLYAQRGANMADPAELTNIANTIEYFSHFSSSDVRTGQQLITLLSVLAAIDNNYMFQPSSDPDFSKKLMYMKGLDMLANSSAQNLVMQRERMLPELPELWMDVPKVKPRAFKVRKKLTYSEDVDNAQGTPVPTPYYRYREDIVFVTPMGRVVSSTSNEYTDEVSFDAVSSPLPLDIFTQTDIDTLKNQGFTDAAFPNAQNESIIAISEASQEKVRLYSRPTQASLFVGQDMFWGIETPNSKMENGQLQQEILSDKPTMLGAIVKGSGSYWLTDITDLRDQWLIDDVPAVFGLGLQTPKEVLQHMSDGLFVPQDVAAQNVMTQIWGSNDFNNQKAGSRKAFITGVEVPILSDLGGSPQQVAVLRRGDYFSFEKVESRVVNGQDVPVIKLADNTFVPLNSVKDVMIYDTNLFETATSAFTAILPWVLFGLSKGPTIGKAILKVLTKK